ncbi:MAG: hypothetical protein H0T60_04880 [Acidobacteria bacterium]|nr:hypothetical protein [Acidobacteriota bacterium]
MANFINKNIVGDGPSVSTARGFRAIKKTDIGSPVYDARYFETFPTVWASAYAFSRELGGNGGSAAADLAVEEWATLFLLHFFGAVHLHAFSKTDLQNHQLYDKDLWLALSGTYPEKSGDSNALDALHLLETDAGTVVGAYYPETVFFPSRGRSAWRADGQMRAYLNESDPNSLSWARSRQELIATDHARDSFREHLESIAYYALPTSMRPRLLNFVANEFPRSNRAPGDERPTREVDKHPAHWPLFHLPPDPTQLLEAYPLRRQKDEGGYIYYLVDKMPHTEPWMETMTYKPYHYSSADSSSVTVQHGRKQTQCPLQLGLDEIVQLETLFLDERSAPFWCDAPTKTEAHVSLIHPLHRSEVADPRVTQTDKVFAAFLAPINDEFLRHFPDIAGDATAVSKTVLTDPSGKVVQVDWRFTLLGRSINWRTRPIYSRDLKGSSLALYPPRTSKQWHLYAAYGIGDKNKCGRWNLVDEHGVLGTALPVEEDEYVSVLQGDGSRPNRPRYLMLSDGEGDGQVRGVFFLAGLTDVSTQSVTEAQLAVDFGTSNTCLAFRNGKSEVVKFKLSPERLWGTRPTKGEAAGGALGGALTTAPLEQPGFVPFEWGGDKGYFPTVLLSRKFDPQLNESLLPAQLKLRHLFEVDIPGLHKGLEERLNEGTFNRLWEPHWNLKWEQKDSKSEPWRTLFLELLMLYAHTEIFFSHGAKLDGYTFTFPLALSNPDGFHQQAEDSVRRVRHYCYGTALTDAVPNYDGTIDESTAIALEIRLPDDPDTIELFIDIGGGSTDYAVRYNNRLVVLDSVKVAGRTFFEFGEKNLKPELELNGAVQFRRHLGKLIQGKEGAEFKIVNPDKRYGLGVAYSVGINALDDSEFAKREAALLEQTMGDFSYQQYRTQLFFRHVLAYGLLQVCAAVVHEKLSLASGINLVLSGNGWGLLLFADLSRKSDALRDEATFVLNLLTSQLKQTLAEDERQYLDALKIFEMRLLNKKDLSTAKTSVALGALKKNDAQPNGDEFRRPFSGITVNGLRIDKSSPIAVRWWERWGLAEFRQKLNNTGLVNISKADFELPSDTEKPIDPVLGVFTLLGNFSGGGEDGLPASTWKSMNHGVRDYVRGMQGKNVQGSPINHFLSNVLYAQDEREDFLDKLAEEHDHFTRDK